MTMPDRSRPHQCGFNVTNDDPDNPEPIPCRLKPGHRRKHRVLDYRELLSVQPVGTFGSSIGRVQDLVGCPFCEAETQAYRWSRWGGGKRCDGCPAVLTGTLAYRERDVEPSE